MKIVLATHNRHKMEEMAAILKNEAVTLLTLDEFPQIGEIEETGTTLLENALIKARTVNELTGLPALADDTGLEVDALDGAPGVYSARYAGEKATFSDNCNKLLEALAQTPDTERTARFRTVVAFVDGKREYHAEGAVEGIIAPELRGKDGFGYDPIFWVPDLKKTFAELKSEEKNAISHRGKALENMRKLLKTLFETV